MGLNGLLIEIGARTAAAVEPVAANGPKVTLLGHLQFGQPAQGLKSPLEHRLLPGCLSGDNQGVRELGVVVGQFLLKPWPVGVGAGLEALHEPAHQHLSRLVDEAVAAHRRRYSWMPIRPNAQARGELKLVSAGSASAKSCPAIIWKLRKGERPTPIPSAHSALP